MFERCESALAEQVVSERTELGERALGGGLEPAPLGGENDPERAPVRGVPFAAHHSLALEQADHGRHRLLAQPRAARELSHAQSVLLEQRHEDRAVARAHLAPAGGAESLLEKVVPALRRLGEEEAEIVPIHD